LLIVAGMSLLLGSCINNDQTAAQLTKAVGDSANFTTIQWMDSAVNYGKITEGQKLAVVYRFKNTGDKPLIITDVRPGCGCTVADKPTEPIMPGREGKITAEYDSQGQHVGEQHKKVLVTANTKPQQSFDLSFSVEVEAKKS
jgi:hypothetical protein